MSVISTNQVNAGVTKGVTWGTEVVLSSKTNLYASNITVSGGFQDLLSRDFGQGPKRTAQARVAFNANFSCTCDLTFGQGWLVLFAALMGTESTPAEQTVSQADYLINHDLADDTFGQFLTLGYSVETDRVISIPSLKITSFSLNQDINGNGTITFQGIGDVWDETSVSTVGNLQGNTVYSPYEEATLGGANHYFRINADTGAGLSSGDNKTITGYTITLSRAHQTRFGLRGAASKYTMEPKAMGPIDCMLTVRLSELDNASYDAFTHWKAATTLKAELFIDGAAIASGVNSSLKWQFPYIQAIGAIPPGHDVANNNSLFLPSITYRAMKRLVAGVATAPTGMTGVTDYLRLAEIHRTRSTKWLT